jgi:hypothetical protein
MNLFFGVIKRLFPPWRAWIFPDGFITALIKGYTISIGDAKEFLSKVKTEAFPNTAVEMLPEWFERYGLVYDETKTIEELQQIVTQRYSSVGGQDFDYLRSQMDAAGFEHIFFGSILEPIVDESGNNIVDEDGNRLVGVASDFVSLGNFNIVDADGNNIVDESGNTIVAPIDAPPNLFYVVEGEVSSQSEGDRLIDLIERIFPAHLQPIYNVVFLVNIVDESGNNIVDESGNNIVSEFSII